MYLSLSSIHRRRHTKLHGFKMYLVRSADFSILEANIIWSCFSILFGNAVNYGLLFRKIQHNCMSVSFVVSFLFQLVDVDTDWNDFPKMPLPSFIRVELLGQSISIALTL